MVFPVLAGFAAEERRAITTRTLAGKKEKASRGGFASGAVPLGYKKDFKGGLVIDEPEAEIVRQIVRMREDGFSFREIATALNESGAGSKRGAKFYATTIRYMLDNPKYRGCIEYYFRHDDEAYVLRQATHESIVPKAA